MLTSGSLVPRSGYSRVLPREPHLAVLQGYPQLPKVLNAGLMAVRGRWPQVLTAFERVAMLHGLALACLSLVGRFIVAPVLALRAHIGAQMQRGDVTATVAAGPAGDIMLGMFSIPGLRWALALVVQGRPDRVTNILAAAVIRVDHDRMRAREAYDAEQASIRGARLFRRLATIGLAFAR